MNQKEFALRIRGLRKEHDLTQEDLAAKLGVSRQTIFLVETGQCLPSLEHALKLAAIFDQTIDSLLNEEIDEFFDETLTMPALNIRQDDKNIFVEIAVPGFSQDEIQTETTDGYLTITLPKKN